MPRIKNRVDPTREALTVEEEGELRKKILKWYREQAVDHKEVLRGWLDAALGVDA